MKFLNTKGSSTVAGVAIAFAVLIIMVFATVFITSIGLPISAGAAINTLEDQGYVVLSPAGYTSLSNRIDALKVSADVAVANAEAAATLGQITLDTLLLHNENEVFLWPESVTATATLTAGASSDNFSAWTELIDSSANSLSANFTTKDGYLVEIMTHDYSVNATDRMFSIELAYGNVTKTVIGRIKVRSDWTYVLALRSVVIPQGQTIYYRMKSEIAGADLKADFRYYYK